ncbi:3,4-dihydroxy-2-butanone-4-phosphate synthase [Sphingomonas sp.]|uniref:3,4-dihydroxy-2-butanone-4-phosphate synthase n=1 Tax=Sphingomonas sp. TaxID=28214 RepID=UPI003B00396A
MLQRLATRHSRNARALTNDHFERYAASGRRPAATRVLPASLSAIEAIIQDAIDGQPYILVDTDDRDNEGDIIIPAQFATLRAINFMAKHARRLVVSHFELRGL